MATFLHIDDEFAKMRMFRTQENQLLVIRQFENGIATIKPTGNYRSLEEFVEVISGCLDENSNFRKALFNAYGCSEDTKIKGIEIIIIGIKVFIQFKSTSRKEILDLITGRMLALCGRDMRLVIDNNFDSDFDSFLTLIDEKTQIEFASDEDEEAWDKQTEFLQSEYNEDGYAVVDYARRLAKYIQYLIDYRKKDFYVAMDEAYIYVKPLDLPEKDFKSEAIYLLTKYWKYREELIKWERKLIAFQMQDEIDNL